MPKETPQPPRNRRGFLKLVSLKAIAGLSRTLPLGGWPNSPRSDSTNQDLPGEGSIFQPRQDQRLEEWLKKHPKKD